ncbi:hypothetical protein ACFLUZ_07230 [Chloroflexota bacterium]
MIGNDLRYFHNMPLFYHFENLVQGILKGESVSPLSPLKSRGGKGVGEDSRVKPWVIRGRRVGKDDKRMGMRGVG